MRHKQEIIFELLSQAYPDVYCQLKHSNPFELLIAVMLSAQCTDKRVNQITFELFQKLKTPRNFIEAGEDRLGEMIKSCGLYKNKSKNIIETCKILLEKHNGKVPDTMEELVDLPGVGRKTAGVVLSNAFGIPAMPVDTHVFRISNRIGLVNASDVEKTEKQLMEQFPEKLWIKLHHLLIYHGRQTCHAKKPECKKCKIKEHCDFTNVVFK